MEGCGTLTSEPTCKRRGRNDIRLALEPEPHPWKNFVAYYLRRAYGPKLSHGKELLTTNYSYAEVAELGRDRITEHAKRAFEAYGWLPRLHAHQVARMREA